MNGDPGPPSSRLTQIRVLVVDDDGSVLDIYGRVLERAGFWVVRANSGERALQLLLKHRFDVVLSDQSMPGIAGTELAQMIREQDQELPFVLMSGTPALDSAVIAIELGISLYLEKPVSPQRLVTTVEQLASQYRSRRAAQPATTQLFYFGEKAALSAAFERAQGSLWMAFQPILRLSERRVFGYEALVRSEEPRLTTPSKLLRAALRLEREHELGRQIRALTAQAAAAFAPDLLLFVNVSSTELADEALLDPGAPLSAFASRVVLEITERTALHVVPDLRNRRVALRRLGYRIGVDNLGAGAAGLSSLLDLEPDFVKFDPTLIRDVDGSPRRRTLVRSLARMCAHDLDMTVICHGVETRGELDTLQSDGFDLLQGYLLGEPERAP